MDLGVPFGNGATAKKGLIATIDGIGCFRDNAKDEDLFDAGNVGEIIVTAVLQCENDLLIS